MKALELRTLKKLQEEFGPKGHYLLAVSGGVDSVVMLEILSRIQAALDWKITVAYVHHGKAESAVQEAYRDQAQQLVEKLANEKDFDFVTNYEDKNSFIGGSEEALRRFRYSYFKKWVGEKSITAVLLAHQSGDLLESQLIQLIRGTGISTSKTESFAKIRPLAECTKEEILVYAKENNLVWLEDPSNQETGTLRNWLRSEWLPQLERYREGSLESFSRSLELLWNHCENANEILFNKRLWISHKEVSRQEFLQLSLMDQRRVIAAMMNNAGAKNYALGHIKEVLKRLDTDQKELSFTVAKSTWHIGPVVFKIHVDSRPDGSSQE